MPTTVTRSAHVAIGKLGNKQQQRRRFLSGEEPAFASVLVALLVDHFGDFEWFDWEPDVLGQEVEDDFGVSMPPEVRDKIWGLVSALTTDRFYHDPLFLNHVANALSDEPLNMQVYEPADLDEIAWALIEVGMSDTDDGEEMDFNDEVTEYLRQLLKREGLPAFGPFDFIGEVPFSLPSDDQLLMTRLMQEREARQDQLLGELEEAVAALHRQLDALEIQQDRRRKHARPAHATQ